MEIKRAEKQKKKEKNLKLFKNIYRKYVIVSCLFALLVFLQFKLF